MADTTALPLQQLIASLDDSCLPKILKVCSGVYFQGSVYEISGSEVCFSTGDIIKVIGIELISVCCEDVIDNKKLELPINHTGLFKVVPEDMPYHTIEEMVSLRPVGLESCLPFSFTTHSKMTIGNLTLGAGTALTVLSVQQLEGEGRQARCRVQGQQEASAEVVIPLSYRGEFYECESEEYFPLREIMSSANLRSRKFRFIDATKYPQPLILTPIYQVHAMMKLRKSVLKFPSSLEVDVIDMTEVCKDLNFAMPLSLPDVLSQPDEFFPAVMEILESPKTQSMFKCDWLTELNQQKNLVFHKKGTSVMVLLSSLRSRKVHQYFLVSQQYNGRFRRRPREFNSVYEIHVASIKAPDLTVSVTRNCEEVEEEGQPALSVGEKLKVVRWEKMELACGSSERQSVEGLLCQRLQEEDDDDDDDDEEEVKQENEREEIFLPLYMQSHFVEVLTDNKKHRLKDFSKDFSLPLDVKIVSYDTELKTDPLVGSPCLRVEGIMLEPTIQASFSNRPGHCFEIPTQWLAMSVCFTKEPLPWPSDQAPKCHMEMVTEVTDTFFYEFHKRRTSDEPPPPRPPKRNLSSSDPTQKSSKPSKKASKRSKKRPKANKSKDQPNVPTKELANMTLHSKKRPPAPPPPVFANDQPPPVAPRKNSEPEMTRDKALPNTYIKMEESMNKAPVHDIAADVDSDHDYEIVDDTLAAMMNKAHKNVMYH